MPQLHTQRQGQGHRVERVFGGLPKPIEEPFTDPHGDQSQHGSEAEVDHGNAEESRKKGRRGLIAFR